MRPTLILFISLLFPSLVFTQDLQWDTTGLYYKLVGYDHKLTQEEFQEVKAFLQANPPAQLSSREAFPSDRFQLLVNKILCLSNHETLNIWVAHSSFKAYALELNAKNTNSNLVGRFLFVNEQNLMSASQEQESVIIGILAHEIAHFLRGDAWKKKAVLKKRCRHEIELAADEFTGRILGIMNFPLDTALQCLNGVSKKATEDYPSYRKRKKSIRKGWKRGIKISIKEKDKLESLINCRTIDSPFGLETDLREKPDENNRARVNIQPIMETNRNIQMADIDKVVYYLPDSFPNQVYKSKKAPFGISIVIYGGFEIRASIFLKDGREYLLRKKLEYKEDKQEGLRLKVNPVYK